MATDVPSVGGDWSDCYGKTTTELPKIRETIHVNPPLRRKETEQDSEKENSNTEYELETNIEDYMFDYPRSMLYNRSINDAFLGVLALKPCDEETGKQCKHVCQVILWKLLTKANMKAEDKQELIKILIRLKEIFDSMDSTQPP